VPWRGKLRIDKKKNGKTRLQRGKSKTQPHGERRMTGGPREIMQDILKSISGKDLGGNVRRYKKVMVIRRGIKPSTEDWKDKGTRETRGGLSRARGGGKGGEAMLEG